MRTIDIDLIGPISVIEAFVPPMIEARRGGHLVNVSSAAGLLGLPWHAPYSAAKFGLRGVSEVLRFDLRRHRIGVSLVCPGGVDTPLVGTVNIVGVDRDAPALKKMTGRFQSHAVIAREGRREDHRRRRARPLPRLHLARHPASPSCCRASSRRATTRSCGSPTTSSSPSRRSRRRATELAMPSTFTPLHRGGSGSPMVLLHGFTDTWRSWELVLPELEKHHDVLAPTLLGHAGGPPLEGEISDAAIADAVERGDGRGRLRDRPHRRQLARRLSGAPARRARSRRVRRRAGAGRRLGSRATRPGRRRSTTSPTMQKLLEQAARARRRDRRLARGPAPRDRVHRHQLRAHPGRADRPPDGRRRLLPGRLRADRVRAASTAGASTPSGSSARSASSGAPRTGSSAGRRPRPATATTGCRTPTGSSSTASATARSSTFPPRRRS